MTHDQARIIRLIEHQRKVVSQFPDDLVERATLETLFIDLRRTFFLVPAEPASDVVYMRPSSRVSLTLVK